MRELYDRYEANYPRLGTDTFFADSKNTYRYFGTIENAMRFAEDEQLLMNKVTCGIDHATLPTLDREDPEAKVLLKDGSRLTLCDYASAGKLWNGDSRAAVWVKVK